MDLLAHVLWAGVAAQTLQQQRRSAAREPPPTSALVALVVLSALPDLVQGLPVAAWALASGEGPQVLWRFATATPDTEPALPGGVQTVAHHLHCIGHSAVVATAATALALALKWRHSWVLAGWWLHIVIDVFTHSAAFYPVPVLYPITMTGFDGLAWNTPWFQALNYGALVLAGLWLWHRRRRQSLKA